MIQNNKTQLRLLILIIVTIAGGVLRFWNLGMNPLWIDEALFASFVRGASFRQEFPTVLLCRIFSFDSEFWLRFLSALTGTLTIPAMYLFVKNYKIEAAIATAFFPIFVFWSRMARPYAFAGFFMVIGWRFWYFNIIAILTQPLAIFGIKLGKIGFKIVAFLIILTFFVYYFRNDQSSISYGIRMLYLPLLALMLHFSHNPAIYKKYIYAVIIIISILFLPSHSGGSWYSGEVKFADWRKTGNVTFSSNKHVSNYYSKGYCLELNDQNIPFLMDNVQSGETVAIALDYYALQENLPDKILNKFRLRLLTGEVVRLKLFKNEFYEY